MQRGHAASRFASLGSLERDFSLGLHRERRGIDRNPKHSRSSPSLFPRERKLHQRSIYRVVRRNARRKKQFPRPPRKRRVDGMRNIAPSNLSVREPLVERERRCFLAFSRRTDIRLRSYSYFSSSFVPRRSDEFFWASSIDSRLPKTALGLLSSELWDRFSIPNEITFDCLLLYRIASRLFPIRASRQRIFFPRDRLARFSLIDPGFVLRFCFS